MAQRKWVRQTSAAKIKIPPAVQTRIEKRLLAYAEENLTGRYERLEIRFRGQYCYIDAYQEPNVPDNWPPREWGETRDEMIARLRAEPIHLCRLRYLGSENTWEYAFYTYSHERYELAVFPTGAFVGMPEEALQASSLYLQ